MAKPKKKVIEFRNYYLPMHFPVLLLSGDYWKISDIPSGRLHFHNCLEIGVCHSGGGILEIYGEKCPFKGGDITVIPRNVPHTTYSSPGTESLWSYLFLDPKKLFHNILPVSGQYHDLNAYSSLIFKHIFNRSQYPNVSYLIMNVIQELEEQRPSYQLSAKGLLLSLYIEICRIQNMEENGGGTDAKKADAEQSDEKSLVIAPVLDYIENNYMQQFTIEFLADLCHWSSTHFRRVFHEIMGTSPLDYLNNTRIMKSCNLLQSTEESILNISEMVGFHSVSSYNRYFTKIMQMSPREYRKQMQQTDKHTKNQTILELAGWMLPE